MPETKIEWTGKTWNPTVGCSRVSEGCRHCYAEVMAARIANAAQAKLRDGNTITQTMEAYRRVVRWQRGGKFPADADDKALPRWNGRVELIPEALEAPLHWRKPARVFVNSMSDLFHEALSFPQIAAVLGVVAACPHLTFQVLTKRPEVAAEWYAWIASVRETEGSVGHFAERALGLVGQESARHFAAVNAAILRDDWPLPNLELGTSVENQPTAELRIPEILRCPAAVHFVSYEPALAAVDFKRFLARYRSLVSGMRYTKPGAAGDHEVLPGLDWIIVGGESGPLARPFDVAWARETVRQCREAGVPVFVKQLGAHPWRRLPAGVGVRDYELPLRDRKGGDPSEWPEDLRVREFPRERRLVA